MKLRVEESRSRGLEVGAVRAQLKAMHVDDNDLVILRIADATPSYLIEAQRVLAAAIAAMKVRALGIVTDKHIDAMAITDIPPEFWDTAASIELRELRERYRTLQRRLSGEEETVETLTERLAALSGKRVHLHDRRCALTCNERCKPRQRTFRSRYDAAKLSEMSEQQLRDAYAKPCEFAACRARTGKLNANLCRGHEAITKEMERRLDPLDLDEDGDVDDARR